MCTQRRMDEQLSMRLFYTENLGASRMVKTSGWSFLHHATMLTVPDG
ncbi:hypothetical protein KIH21_05925 [Lacticaseibacillus paracasei subsp. paracasei]|nr:hypothetical protein KIH21_05925 [Lacticaseibacillus paracasei subsp. paracasei]